ncbi:FMN-dependent NADH-azoreductase [Sporosarcina sp. FSL W7-1349]|uniref:FMN-dependent NADH-azoreductase n=1 Tax=Bacillales TaxID=1385 RepID=UPI0005822BD3|nr:FMN-dependent NADH-azoreductase [Bacillus sp. OxB-1]BAQ10982.1 FMN-dependent NADH-azoreductase [Bacillus sp. OxB-1]
MNVLVVKANNRPAEQAVTSKMYDVFMEEVSKSDQLAIETFDVFEEDMPYFGQDFLSAMGKQSKGLELTEIERRILAASTKALDAFMKADTVVFVFPLWNKTIPAPLQTFIDYIYRAGVTFRYTEEGPIGLVPEKKVIILNARGDVYSAPHLRAMEMSVSYIRMIMEFFGVQDFEEVIIEGHNKYRDRAAEIIEEGMEKTKEMAARLAEGKVHA